MIDSFKKGNGAALAFMIAGSLWFLVGALYGLISALDLVAPEIFNNIAFLSFGRARPAHVNTVVYGFIGTTLVGCGLYYTPALLKTKIWSEKLNWVGFVFWNMSVLSGPVTFGFGLSQGREYAEYIWIFDVTLAVAMLSLIANLVMTIVNRKERTLYVSVWYFICTFLWTSLVYFLGNVMWHPQTGAMPGILDSIFLWFYGHNLVGLLLTPLAVGALYYVIPRVTKTPIYSHGLSLIGFWTLIALYSHIGGHHLLQAPIPSWLKTVAVVDSMAMIIPVFAVLVNVWMTARGRAGLVLKSVSGRFVIMGSAWYLLTSVQGSVQSLPFFQRVSHFNNWTIGHAHIAVMGFAGFIALGALWHILPLVVRKKLYSKRLVNLQFGLMTFGLTGFAIALTIAGLIQGSAWNNGEMVYRVLPQIEEYMIIRAGLGMSIIAAAIIGLANIMLTVKYGKPLDDESSTEGDAEI